MANVSLSIIMCMALLVVSCGSRDTTWRVAITGIPAKIVPSEAEILTTSYVLKQTHEPLFYKDKNGNYASRILDSWHRSIDYKSFELCITKQKDFRANQRFSAQDLQQHIESVLNVNKIQKARIELSNDCVTVSIEDSGEEFLNLFSRIQNAPSRMSPLPGIEDGLGDYIISETDKNILKLMKKADSKAAIKEIEFYNVESIRDNKEMMNKLDDFNHVFLNSIKSIEKSRYHVFDYTPLKEYVLLINVEDKNVRKAIFNCIDIDGIRRVAYPGEENFIDIATLFPLGIKGSQGGLLSRNCLEDSRNISPKKEIVFKVWEDVDSTSLNTILNKIFVKSSGERIVVRKEKYSELITDVVNKNYDLFLMVADTAEPSYYPFFEYIFDPQKGYFKFRDEEAIKLLTQLKSTKSLANQLSISKRLQTIAFSNYLVLPIYQPIRRFYYPKNVSGIFLLEDFLDFPKINRIEF